MGNAVPYNCYERWGKRSPDGPLIHFDPSKPNNGTLSKLLGDFDYDLQEDGTASITKTEATGNVNYQTLNHMNSRVKINTNTGTQHRVSLDVPNTEGTPKCVRTSRRRPTYSPKTRKIEMESEEEEEKEEDEEEEEKSGNIASDGNSEEISANDIRAEKIKQYRKILTKVVKIKTAIFHETVKVTCSKDGNFLEWYKGKADENGKKKPIGHIMLSKISSVRTKSDNPKSLEIAVSSVQISTYLFIFKTREERENWQNNLESFKKIMSMK